MRMAVSTIVMVMAASTWGAPPKFDRPLIYSVNPCGEGDPIGAPQVGSDFVRYNELVWQKVAEAGSRSKREQA